MIGKLRKHYLFIIFILVTVLYCICWHVLYEKDIIYSDGYVYYQYFSRIFITHDFVGSSLIKFPIGTTLLQLPFLVVALVIAKIGGIELQDGLADIFHMAVGISAVFYVILGLILMYWLLEKRYGKKVGTITCICMMWGTLLLEYATTKASFSHACGFFMCILFVCYIFWYEERYAGTVAKKRLWMDLCLGIILGIIVLVRNTNIIIGFVYLLYNITSWKAFKERLRKLFSWKILIQILGFVAIYSLQILCWKLQTGQLILYSYGDESFIYLLDPRIMQVLFSDVKGLFIYSPVLMISMIGMLMYKHSGKEFFLSQCVIFVLQTYIISAWWCWWLGCCYGERMFCDVLIVFAIPFAVFLSGLEAFANDTCEDEKNRDFRKIIYVLIYTLIGIFVVFNFMWMMGYHNGVMDENMSTWNSMQEQLRRFLLN